MDLDYFLKFFVPKDVSFFPLFEEDARIMIKAAELLKELVGLDDVEQREPIVKQIKAVELEGDEMTHKIYKQLNKSFITPFDREDIHELASDMDDVVDTINGVSQRISLYKPKHLIPVFQELAEIIYQASLEIQSSLDGMRSAGRNKEKILQSCINLNTLENKADDLYHVALSAIFQDVADTRELIKLKEIVETLEKSVDKAEDVSDVIKTMLIKMA
jgi:uncharacterized protein